MSEFQENNLKKLAAESGSGLKIPPPIIYSISFVIGISLDYLLPFAPLPRPWVTVIGVILIIISIPIMPPVLARYKKSKTPFDVRKPTTTLVTDGPNQYSRNPTYLSLTLLYLGLGFLINNGWIIVLTVPVLLIMNFWVIRREERHLEATFGEEYLQYKSTVRRWI